MHFGSDACHNILYKCICRNRRSWRRQGEPASQQFDWRVNTNVDLETRDNDYFRRIPWGRSYLGWRTFSWRQLFFQGQRAIGYSRNDRLHFFLNGERKNLIKFLQTGARQEKYRCIGLCTATLRVKRLTGRINAVVSSDCVKNLALFRLIPWKSRT